MIELQTTHIRPRLPKREWLLRCTDGDRNLSTCSICVNDGTIEIISADDLAIELNRSQIADFHAAFEAAVQRADADLAEREPGVPDVTRVPRSTAYPRRETE